MPNRREFLQTGAAVSAIAVNGVVARRADAIGVTASAAPGRALYDDRYVEGRRFAAVMGAQGVATSTLDDGDVTRFYLELEQIWQRGPVAVAGLTQFGPMLVIERIAQERGMRLAMRVEHGAARTGSMAHRFEGPAETLALATGFDALHADWPGLMAMLACRVAADDSPSRTAELLTRHLEPPVLAARMESPFIHYYTPQAEQQGHGPALNGLLYSWVAAPRERG
jgi:hypothetical protein